jgi:hypothetical protein
MTVTFYWGNGTIIDNDTASSGTIASISGFGLNESTNYTWYVNATDGYGGTTRGPTAGNWTFQTGQERAGSSPGFGGDDESELTVLVVEGTIPLPGASISINQGTSPAAIGAFVETATSNVNGYYDFFVPDGNYIITCSLPGYETQQVPLAVSGDTSVVVYMLAITAEPITMDYYCILIAIILLALGVLFAYLAVVNKLDEIFASILVIICGVVVFLIGVVACFILAPVAIILLFVEIFWIKGKFK